MRKSQDPYDYMEDLNPPPSFDGLYETELDGEGRFYLPDELRYQLDIEGACKLVLRRSDHIHPNQIRIFPYTGLLHNNTRINNWQAKRGDAISKVDVTIFGEEEAAGWDEHGNVAVPAGFLNKADFKVGDRLILRGCGRWVELWKLTDWDAEQAGQRKKQEMHEEGNRLMIEELVTIVKQKEKSPYATLRKIYGYLGGLILILGVAAATGALYANTQEGLLSQKLVAWLGIALLFGLPCFAHYFSIVWIELKSPGIPTLGLADNGVSSWKKGPYLACIGFVASGVACWAVATIPQFRAAIEALPLGWLYLPVSLVATVILPFIIWLSLSVLAWRARKDPFGP